MDDTIVRVLRGEASLAEVNRLDAWRAASQENERHFQEVVAVWRLTGDVSADKVGAMFAVDEALLRPGARTPARSGRGWRVAVPAAAAAFVLGLGLGVVALRTLLPERALAVREFTTGSYELVTVQLSDGSTARLAPMSRLRFEERAKGREVWLEGQAFFGIRSDSARPFVVHTSVGDAVVVGTRFDLRVQHEGLRLVVVDGKVMLNTSSSHVAVAAGQMSTVTSGSRPEVVTAERVDSLLSWMNGSLVFERTPLETVAAEITRQYGVKVEIRDTSMLGRTVTTTFNGKTIEYVTEVVCRVIGAECEVRDSVVIVGVHR
jgi:transmembrane sensor